MRQTDTDTDTANNPATRVGDALGKAGGLIVWAPVAIAGRAGHEMLRVGGTMLFALLPFARRPLDGLAKWALQRKHKKAGGDAIGLVFEPDGGVDLVPVKYKPQTTDDGEVERAGWHAIDREQTWHEGADGREVDRLGRTPVVLLDSASCNRATVTEARFAQCLDLDQVDPIVQVPSKDALDVTVQVGGSPANGTAVADGGHGASQMELLESNVKESIWQADVVDIGSGEHDGMRIDPRKVKETYREKTGSEQLDEVERLGFLAGRAGKGDRTGFIIKVLLIALGLVAAATIGPGLFGSMSGATESLAPLMLGLI